jgi:phosphohistidine swiveling domain-containing protein
MKIQKDHSFAGMFSSFLYQKELEDVEKSILRCWASAYTHRCLEYRLKNKLSTQNIGMGVVIQKMVNSDVSGVMFTRNPMDQADRVNIIVEAVFGQCEGLVSGILEADNFKFDRNTEEVEINTIKKESQFIKSSTGAGLVQVELEESLQEAATLTEEQVAEVALLGKNLETIYNMPLDIEWAYERDKLYIVQMRPITTNPPLAFYNDSINGSKAVLWDNSNIVESFAGVTTPLTFSLTKEAYAIVYRQTCRILDVPEKVITQFDDSFENMLGFIRGRVYYNLINWYKLLFLVPGSASNKGFMETMLGVKEELNDEQQELFNFVDEAPKYSTAKKITVLTKLMYKFITIKSVVRDFTDNFNTIYQEYLDTDFSKKSLRELKAAYERWNNNVTYSWKAPIINDFLVMFFFGVLKKLTEKWIPQGDETLNLQNDLLCGQGEIESTMPTITLMKLAAKYDTNPRFQTLFMENEIEQILNFMKKEEYAEVKHDLDDYLYKYGFRCNNEQKLEEEDLTTNPDFIIDALKSYIRSKSYSINEMKEREHKIKNKAEGIVRAHIKGLKRIIYFFVLKHARNAVKNRENMRFLRSKSFGISRRIFRTMDSHLHALGIIDNKGDAFYLTYREIFDFIDGKAESMKLNQLANIRRAEFDEYRGEDDPPDRFLTYGIAGASVREMQIIRSGDLLKNKMRVSDDPNLVYGISCCPGVIKGKVRVAESIEDARNLDGEILITKRTDPGWVPLFPSCSGLIVERGSLLSHSAVIARELGLPTIVGVSASIMSKLQTGDMVELNATQGEIRIIHEQ